jgi:hypothetical protein
LIALPRPRGRFQMRAYGMMSSAESARRPRATTILRRSLHVWPRCHVEGEQAPNHETVAVCPRRDDPRESPRWCGVQAGRCSLYWLRG